MPLLVIIGIAADVTFFVALVRMLSKVHASNATFK